MKINGKVKLLQEILGELSKTERLVLPDLNSERTSEQVAQRIGSTARSVDVTKWKLRKRLLKAGFDPHALLIRALRDEIIIQAPGLSTTARMPLPTPRTDA